MRMVMRIEKASMPAFLREKSFADIFHLAIALRKRRLRGIAPGSLRTPDQVGPLGGDVGRPSAWRAPTRATCRSWGAPLAGPCATVALSGARGARGKARESG